MRYRVVRTAYAIDCGKKDCGNCPHLSTSEGWCKIDDDGLEYGNGEPQRNTTCLGSETTREKFEGGEL